jgi:hypothetical protein
MVVMHIDDYIQVERGEDEGATFPPFFPLSFFFLFLFSSPLSSPFRGDLKVFHQHDLKAVWPSVIYLFIVSYLTINQQFGHEATENH